MNYDEYRECLDKHAKNLFTLTITTESSAVKHVLRFDSEAERAEFIRDFLLIPSTLFTSFKLSGGED